MRGPGANLLTRTLAGASRGLATQASTATAASAARAHEPPKAARGEALADRGFCVVPAAELGAVRGADLKPIRDLIREQGRDLTISHAEGGGGLPKIQALRCRAEIGEGGELQPLPAGGEGEVKWSLVAEQPALAEPIRRSLDILLEAAKRKSLPRPTKATVFLRDYTFSGWPGTEGGLPPHADPYTMSMMAQLHARNVRATNSAYDPAVRADSAEDQVSKRLGTSKPGEALFVDHGAVKHDLHMTLLGNPSEGRPRDVERQIIHVAVGYE